jgi:energy-coupling factor transport system permease protein
MAAYVLTTTTVSEFMAAMSRLHLPNALVIPFAVVLRMLPTLANESAGISESMRTRGLRLGRATPAALVEYRIVPLVMRAVDVGDELSAAALTRGLGGPVTRTSIAHVGLGAFDLPVVIVSVVSVVAWAVG